MKEKIELTINFLNNMSNSERFPEAWKVFIDCVRKWEVEKQEIYPDGWKYGIPNPEDRKDYLYSGCIGKLFIMFKDGFYKKSEIHQFRKFLFWLEEKEGKTEKGEYENNVAFLEGRRSN
jgi:hypothetical protein